MSSKNPYTRLTGPRQGVSNMPNRGGMRISWNIKEVMESLTRDMPKAVAVGAMQGLYEAGKEVLKVAYPLVPKSYKNFGRNTLADSGAVVPTEMGGIGRLSTSFVKNFDMGSANSSVMVQYNAPYATYVHEDTTKKHGQAFNTAYAKEIKKGSEHQKSPQEQAMWLPKAMEMAHARVRQRLDIALRRALQRVKKAPTRWGTSPAELTEVKGAHSEFSETSPYGSATISGSPFSSW
jgi:hypothetical protein